MRPVAIALAIVCYADAFKFCSGAIDLLAPDYNKIGACLYAHRDQVDAPCKEALKKWTPKKPAGSSQPAPSSR